MRMALYGEKAMENVIHVSLLVSGGVDEFVGGRYVWGGDQQPTMGSNQFKV